MGIYDRDYYRDDKPAGFWSQRSVTVNLIVINVVIYIVTWFLVDSHRGSNPVIKFMKLDSDYFLHPWEVWRLLTYGFAHAEEPMHVIFNMLALYIFGRDVEGIYGRKEYLKLYLSLIITSGIGWVLLERLPMVPAGAVIGASGAVTGVMVIYVMHYPRRMFLVFGIAPMPAWAVATAMLAFDVMGSFQRDNGIANTGHLAGALFGYLYYRTGWQLGSLIPKRLSLAALKMSPKLRVHKPDEEEPDTQQSVDDVLAKISREGEASLTPGERRILEEASRRYQRRRQ